MAARWAFRQRILLLLIAATISCIAKTFAASFQFTRDAFIDDIEAGPRRHFAETRDFTI